MVWIAGIVLGVATVKVILLFLELIPRFAERDTPRHYDLNPFERSPGHRMPSCPQELCPANGCPYGPAANVSEPPYPCLARSVIWASICFYFIGFLLFFVTYGQQRWLYDVVFYSPAFAIFVALGFLTVLVGLVSFVAMQWRSLQVPIVLILVVGFGLANNDRFKLRFENLSYDNARIVPLRHQGPEHYSPRRRAAHGPLCPRQPTLIWLTTSRPSSVGSRNGGKTRTSSRASRSWSSWP